MNIKFSREALEKENSLNWKIKHLMYKTKQKYIEENEIKTNLFSQHWHEQS